MEKGEGVQKCGVRKSVSCWKVCEPSFSDDGTVEPPEDMGKKCHEDLCKGEFGAMACRDVALMA